MIPLSCQRGTLHIGLALVWNILLSNFSMDTTSKQDIDVEKNLFPILISYSDHDFNKDFITFLSFKFQIKNKIKSF